MKPNEVIEEGRALAADLDDLVVSIKEHEQSSVTTHPLPKIEHDPTDARKIISEIQNIRTSAYTIPKSISPSSRIAQVVARLDHLSNPAPPPKPSVTVPTKAPLAPMTRFEEVVEKVAKDIAKKVEELQLKEASNLSSLLGDLASAARDGNRKHLLEHGKKVSLAIKEFTVQLREYSSKIPKKNRNEFIIQDRLIRAAQGLENFGTQLRILTSVKAASVETDKDTDQSLNSIVQGIGATVTDGLTAIDITHKTLIKTK